MSNYLFEILLWILLGICPGVELLDYMLVLFFIFWGNSILFSIGAAPFYIPNSSARGFQCLYILAHACHFLICWQWPSSWLWGDISLRFWFAFIWWRVILSIFSYVCWLFLYHLWRTVCSSPLSIFKVGYLFFVVLVDF